MDVQEDGCPEEDPILIPPPLPHRNHAQLTQEEKKFLLSVERGDLATVRRNLLNYTDTSLNVNCVDPLGRSALLMAIDNENLEMVELLLDRGVDTKDALLHAINEEYVEAVEVLLEHEEAKHTPGQPYSWESVDWEVSAFTPDITPLVLAAHRNNYEIIKILLDRGATLPMPHDIRCACGDCVRSCIEDSLNHSRSRINAYRALASPSLVALSSKDPILTAFELSSDLRRLSFLEHEYKCEYLELRKQCQEFVTSLLDHTRSSYELEVLLNYDPSSGAALKPAGDIRMRLSRLKLAIKHKQKKFCAHPNVQQLLASIWYEGLPGFRRKNILLQCLEIIRIGLLFPFYSLCYIVAPYSAPGRTLKRPFIKFICNSASYVTFLFLLILASQRIENVIVDLFGTDEMKKKMKNTGGVTTKRGAPPSFVEWLILAWVIGLIWSEIKQLWELGLVEYVGDMWNIIDFITNSLYVATIALRIVVYFQMRKEMTLNTGTAHLPREEWDAWDPILIAEGLFAAANIFSSLKLVYIFSVNPYLGPLQVCLGRMVIDIIKFFFFYTLVLFAFACGMNQLLWYYADMEKQVCLTNQDSPSVQQGACLNWRRFSNLFESSQTLFWASFGLIELENFELSGIQSYTRFWGLLMFGSYCVINVVVLLNLLIAMMNHSYQVISEQADTEWKYARCKLWLSFFEDGATVPPPLNIIPTPKSVFYFCRWLFKKLFLNTARKEHLRTIRRRAKQAMERDFQYQNIMRNLVRRYVTDEQRKADNQGVTEDDVNEIKQDISSFRYEIIEVMKNSGFNTSATKEQGQSSAGKKGRQKERRLMKGFDIGLVESSFQSTPEVSVDDTNSPPSGPRMAKIARLATRKKKQGKWSHLVEATRHAKARFSRSKSEDSLSSSVGKMERRNDSTSSSGSSIDQSAETPVDIPVINKRSLFARKLGNALSSSRLRLAFLDSEKVSANDNLGGSKNKVRDSSADRDLQAQRTVSAPFSQWLGTKSNSLDYLGRYTSDQHQLSSVRSLSPIPSCASSNVPTPRSSITGQPETVPHVSQPEERTSILPGVESVNYSANNSGWI